ncbi:hypothetical protein [Sediminibacterium ginsengisoli]|uniref:Acyl carrier protein n=1 Tax=Sediminibacterium ginsengisoli TaxID=413434 RepID=A0A1T4JYZ6_9BACT|nr:hypothetical protein [Sediminibacterium ginsengisoli]SJZ35410.1 acyl carrier protein [Sediminibacterium ginsengisoli]
MQTPATSIQHLLRQKLNIHPVTFAADADLKRDLGLTDWEIAYLFNAIEETWHIHINDNEASSIASINQLVETVRKRVFIPESFSFTGHVQPLNMVIYN